MIKALPKNRTVRSTAWLPLACAVTALAMTSVTMQSGNALNEAFTQAAKQIRFENWDNAQVAENPWGLVDNRETQAIARNIAPTSSWQDWQTVIRYGADISGRAPEHELKNEITSFERATEGEI